MGLVMDSQVISGMVVVFFLAGMRRAYYYKWPEDTEMKADADGVYNVASNGGKDADPCGN